MDKVKKILEGYVEWIALALGACFLGWMVYSYIVLPPVTVSVGGTTVPPGQIDQQIWESVGKNIKAQIDQHLPPVKVPVPAFGEVVARALGEQAPATSNMDYVWNVGVMPPAASSVVDVVVDKPTLGGAKVTVLPTAPKLTGIATSNGHSNLLAAADPATGAASAAGPVAVAPPNPNGVVPVVNQATDKGWVTVGGTLPSSSALAAEFAKCKIPAVFQKTTVLRVELFRQEMDGNGNWGPETLVPPPPIDQLPPMPPEVNVDAASARAQQNYRQFADKSATLILRPAFFQVVQGDKWYAPGAPNPNVKVDELVEDKFDPSKYPVGTSVSDLTQEEKDEVFKWRKDQAAAAAKAKAAAAEAARKAAAANRGSRGGRGGAGGAGPGGGAAPGGGNAPNFMVADPDRANAVAMMDGPTIFDVPPAGRAPGEEMPGVPAQATGTTAADLPQGAFDPAAQKDFLVWAHDTTVKPGKTYRYRLRYSISNPVYNTRQLCQPQALAAQFTITSEKSDWSTPVNVESDSNFYASAVSPRGSVTFDVFKWQNGIWTLKSVTVDPGDTIAGADWTVVDIRTTTPYTNNNPQIILASDNGTLERDLATDKKNKTHHELLVKVNGPQAQQPGVNPDGGAGGPPPPGFRPGMGAGPDQP